jgi:patatin-like phospholipase/acyl hydrolase
LHKIFDCVGGTSIGGILALASTGTLDGQHPVCSTKDLMDIFEVYGNRIFKKSQIKQLTNLFDTKYDVSSFEDLLSSYLKDSKLSDTLRETNVVITAVNRLTNEDMIFRSINAIFDRNKDFYMRDIARATSAAPTYFPSAEIKNVNATEKYSLIDGGVGLNNPSKLVIDDIIKTTNSGSKNNYFLLSLGTGRLKCEVIPESAGIVNLAPIIDSFTESANFFIEKGIPLSNSDLSENYKGHYMRLSPLINMNRKDA